MAASDRTQYKQVVAGSLGDSRTLSTTNPLAGNGVIAQDSQRYAAQSLPNLAINTYTNISMARLDRPVLVKECRILPAAAANIAAQPAGTNFTLGYTNDNGGTFTSVATINSNTVANGGTGNLVQFVSVPVTLFTPTTANANLNQTANMIVPSGSHLVLQIGGATPSIALGPVTFQVIWEEV